MKQYFPYPFFHDDVPIDISFGFEDEKPAGKHGFLGIKGRKFVFEDGTEMKFWGTNFNGAGCFPDHAYAEVLARRMAKLGINIIRFHQLDAEWHTPNIFRFTKGKRVTDAALDPESMDRLDYLIYCLKNEGIYVYLDMITYRKFRSDEGVENAHALGDAGKPVSVFSRRLIDLQKEFCRDIWLHENPYTKLAYRDDPVIILTEIANENELFSPHFHKTEYPEPYLSEFHALFNAWLAEHGIDRRAEDISVIDRCDRDLLEFKTELQVRYYTEMYAYMKEIGVRIPIAGTNWQATPDNYRSQLVCDFLDGHAYFYDWSWQEFQKKCTNKGVTQEAESYLKLCAPLTHVNYPTYISEWDMPWPNERRAESVIYSAAIGCFQGWSGFAIHTYSYTAKLDHLRMIGEEVSAPKIGNTPYRQGVFCTWNDPAKFGLFYHAALITRRGDIKEGDVLYGMDVPDLCEWDYSIFGTNMERYKLATSIGGVDGLPPMPEDPRESFARSDTGELYRDWEKELGIIDSDMTKCAYGSLCRNGEIRMKGVTVRCETDYAVIAMSSLTDAPITSSDNILLTTVGRAENTDAKFSGDLMLDVGHAPVVIENIRAEIEIETDQRGMSVWAVSAEGFYIGTVPTEETDGKLRFRVGEISPSMYYLIVKS